MQILGIDIGGTGIKGAPVDVERGELAAERFRLRTPQPAAPEPVAEVVKAIVAHFQWQGPVGCTFPAVVKNGQVLTAAHVARDWVGKDGRRILQEKTGSPLVLLNDADAAGIAEMEFGAGRGVRGLVVLVTLGTGIGTAVFYDGKLLPNTELGHLEIRGKDAERRASDHARVAKKMSWKKWAANVSEYLNRLDALLTPDLFILGGGVSKDHDRFFPYLKTRVKVVPAQMLNEAGIVGAALAARALAREAVPATP